MLQSINEVRHHHVDAFGTRIHVAELGEGPMVLFVHGFPELWYSWRHQLPVVAQAGYRAVAIDVRGYGSSASPAGVDDYRMLCHVADNVGVVQALGEDTAIIVGHDWGAPISWWSALLKPDVFTALGLLSVPYSPRGPVRPSTAFRQMGGDEEFYIEYFQQPGRAEAEFEGDIDGWLRGFYHSASGDAAPRSDGKTMATVAPGGQLRDRLTVPTHFGPWMTEDDFDVYLGEFRRTGLTGGLNRYRNADRDWVDLAAWHLAPITQPALFVGGERDGPTRWGTAAIDRFPVTLPNLYRSVVVPRAGHWVQQEAADAVNEELLGFLSALTR